MFASCGVEWTALWVSLLHVSLIYWALVTMLCSHSMLVAARVGVTHPVRVYGGDQGV